MYFNYIICDEARWLFCVYYDDGVCAEGNWLIQVSAISILLCQKNYISNVKEAVKMQRKACARQK